MTFYYLPNAPWSLLLGDILFRQCNRTTSRTFRFINNKRSQSKPLDTGFYYVHFVSRFLASKCEMSHKSACCIILLFYTNEHDKNKNNCINLAFTILTTNNYALLHVWWKQSFLKHQKFSKYYDHDCLQNFILLFLFLFVFSNSSNY